MTKENQTNVALQKKAESYCTIKSLFLKVGFNDFFWFGSIIF